MSHTVESPDKKESSSLVLSFKQEAAEFKKIQNEVRGMPLEKEFEAWVAAYNLRIRKIQRDAHLHFKEEDLEKNKNEIDACIIDVPLGAYILYLQRELENIRGRYDQVKKEYDQFRSECNQLKKEQDELLEKADKEKDPVKAGKLMEEADKKRKEAEEKIKEKIQRKWIIQNEVASRLFPDFERDMRYVETMVGKMSGMESQDQKKFNDALGAMKKIMWELQGKTQKDAISSEDRMTDYFRAKSNS